ncbi:MAG: hypothetical protein GTO18_13525 [Anaerolineales bacterium]|nr:hypothetical protein [Anaerolineales bacterium]
MGGFLGGCCGFGSYGALGLFLNLVIIVGIIIGFALLIIFLVRRFSPNGQSPSSLRNKTNAVTSAREIIQARYAKGEITREQYQQMLSDLS